MPEQTKIDDGGPAFPQPETAHGNTVGDQFGQGGLSMRDWFAGQALCGILAAHAGDDIALPDPVNAAKDAYNYADAMIEARKE
jgi:hypothetical protein